MWSKTFWLKTIEWTLKAGCAAAVAFLTANGTGILDIDFKQAASVVGLSTLVVFLTCIAGNGVGDKGTPSIVIAENTEQFPYVGTPANLHPPVENTDTTGLEISEKTDPRFDAVSLPTGDEENIVRGDN